MDISSCLAICAIGLGLFGGSVATALVSKLDPPFAEWHAKLSPAQAAAHKRIATHRMRIQTEGAVLGALIIALYTFVFATTFTPTTHGCLQALILLGSQYLYQKLSHKPEWMLDHIKDQPDLVAGWLEIYKQMSQRYHMGFVLGVIGAFFVGRGLCGMVSK